MMLCDQWHYSFSLLFNLVIKQLLTLCYSCFDPIAVLISSSSLSIDSSPTVRPLINPANSAQP